MTKNQIISLLLFAISHVSLGTEIECNKENLLRPSSPTSVEKLITSCEFQKELANQKEVKEKHALTIYKKLASKLALQITQTSEELSLLTTFFHTNNKDLLMKDHSDIQNSIANECRLDAIKKIETCPNGQSSSYKEKLAMLKAALPSNKQTPFQDDQSLYGIMAGKFYSDLGIQSKSNKAQCPLSGSSGTFFLNSQLDEDSAKQIIELLNRKNAKSRDEIFDEYAQLKIIKNSSKDVRDEFKSYLLSIPQGTNPVNNYINAFFFNPNNQKRLGKTIVNQCGTINRNVNRFLCSDLTELGSLNDDVSSDLFGKLNASQPLEKQTLTQYKKDPTILTAYGMQCLAKDKSATERISQEEQSVDQWYNKFSENIREALGQDDSNSTVTSFCSYYNCKENESVKSQPSCKAGGPLSSKDLKQAFGCNKVNRDEGCNTEILKSISYLENFEKFNESISSKNSSIASLQAKNSENQKNESRLPNFAENYLGAEGALKALGKPITPITLADKKLDFSEHKLATKDFEYITPAQQNKQQKTPATQEEHLPSNTYAPIQVATTTTTSFDSQTSENAYKSVSSNSIHSSGEKKQTSPSSKAAASNAEESSKLRAAMEKMLDDLKDNPSNEETNISAAISQDSSTTRSNSREKELSESNTAERDRLKSLARKLDSRSQDLDEYRRELDSRDYSAKSYQGDDNDSKSTSVKGRSQASTGGSHESGSVDSSASGLGGGSASGASVSLSKTSGKNPAEQKNNTAAIIQSGKEATTLSADELTNLSAENLQKLGVDSSQPFTLKVKYQAQTYMVQVKSLTYRGDRMLAPVLNAENKELNKFLLNSPLFKKYREYKSKQQEIAI